MKGLGYLCYHLGKRTKKTEVVFQPLKGCGKRCIEYHPSPNLKIQKNPRCNENEMLPQYVARCFKIQWDATIEKYSNGVSIFGTWVNRNFFLCNQLCSVCEKLWRKVIPPFESDNGLCATYWLPKTSTWFGFGFYVYNFFFKLNGPSIGQLANHLIVWGS